MPFKSESQRKKFYAMASRGEISKATVEHWEDATPKGKKLPEHVAKHAGISFSAFSDELTKISGIGKEAVDPLTIAGLTAGGKIFLSNLLARHGMRIPPIRKLVQEVLGVGYRTAAQGKPLLSRPIREALSLGTDANLVRAYEMAHGAGRLSSRLQLPPGHKLSISRTAASELGVPSSFLQTIEGVPLESKGFRKVIDYGFTPVSQVGRDIGRAVKNLTHKPSPGAITPEVVR